MARVQETFLQQYQSMKYTELHQPIVFVVDMINGFLCEGALHDRAILECVNPIQKLLTYTCEHTIFVSDAHPAQSREFNSYPAHCMMGTKESEVVDALAPYVKNIFHKNSTNTFTCPDFQIFLKEQLSQYHDIIITGCCSDLCIMQFALCLNAYLNEHNEQEKRIILPLDMIDTYHIEGIHDAITNNEFAIRNMEMNGITIVQQIESGETT